MFYDFSKNHFPSRKVSQKVSQQEKTPVRKTTPKQISSKTQENDIQRDQAQEPTTPHNKLGTNYRGDSPQQIPHWMRVLANIQHRAPRQP